MPSSLRPLRPTRSVLDRFLADAEHRSLSYAPVGMSGGTAPEGYRTLEHSAALGSGDEVFARAATALRNWQMLDISWVVLYPDRPVVREGLTVIVAARTLGLWSLNPARVVEIIDEPDRVGFAYGTVEGHTAAGEERFTVLRDGDGVVRYEISAHSRLQHPLAKAARPVARTVQRRFAAASVEAMQRGVTGRS